MTQQLTDHETQILRLIALGRPRKEIAMWLHYSVSAIQDHIARIYRKLGVSNSRQATIYAIRAGVVEREEAVL